MNRRMLLVLIVIPALYFSRSPLTPQLSAQESKPAEQNSSSTQDLKLAAHASRILKLWETQRQEIATAYLKCRTVRRGSSSVNHLSEAELKAILASVDLTKNPDDFKLIVHKTCPKLAEMDPPWAIMEDYFQGPRLKEHAKDGIVEVNDQDANTRYDPLNKQAFIQRPGTTGRYLRSLNDFRIIPNCEKVVVEARNGDLLTMRNGDAAVGEQAYSQQFAVEADTGLIRELRLLREGNLKSLIIQDQFRDFPGGIRFPLLAVRANFSDNGMSSISMTLIEEANFNQELPKDTFRVPVPKDTRVFDWRKSDTANFPTTEQTNDLVSVADSQVNQRQEPLGRSRRMSRWGYVATFLVLAAVLIFVRRRKATIAH